MNEKINILLEEYLPRISESRLMIGQMKSNWFNTTLWFDIADKIIKNFNIDDLIIQSDEFIVDKLKFFRDKKTNSINWEYGNLYFNEIYKEKVCMNVNSLEFISFYPSLLIRMIDNDMIKIDHIQTALQLEYYIIFKYLFYNRNYFKKFETYQLVKSFINYFYGLLHNKYSKVYCENFENFELYKFTIYEYIKKTIGKDLIYLDTDICFYFGDYELSFNLPYEIEKVNNLIVINKKRLIYNKKDIFKFSGFKKFE